MAMEIKKKIKLFEMLARPFVRFALRNGIHFQETLQILKKCFIEEASNELHRTKQKINVSRLSAVTGLQRRELIKISKAKSVTNKVSTIAKVLGLWTLSKKYLDENSKPRSLRYLGTKNEFSKLVKEVSSDLHPGTIMFEMSRMGLISKTDDVVCLSTNLIDLRQDTDDAFKLLSDNTDDLIKAVEKNVFDQKISLNEICPNLHASTEFTNIDPDRLEEVRSWLLYEGSAFHKRAREHLAKYDLDFNPIKGKDSKGARLSFVTYSINEMEVK